MKHKCSKGRGGQGRDRVETLAKRRLFAKGEPPTLWPIVTCGNEGLVLPDLLEFKTEVGNADFM